MRVIARLDPQWLAQVVQGHDLGAGGLANLVHDSRRIYARSVDNAAYLGRPLPAVPLFAPAHRGRMQGRYDEPSVFTGERRQFVYRRVAGAPLTIVVGTPLQSIVGPSRAFLLLALITALLLALLWSALLRASTRRFRSERARVRELQDTAAQLRELQSTAALGHWRWSPATREVQWSDEVYRMHGRDLHAGPPSHEQAWGYVHADDRLRMQALGRAVLAEGGRVDAEFRIVREDGALRWLQLRAERVDTPHGPQLHGSLQDITALAEVRERLRLAQDIARIGDWEWDIASGTILWSETMYSIYGLDPAAFEPNADNVFALIQADDRPRMQAFVRALIETGAPCQSEFRIVRPDGDVRTLSSRGMRETTGDGRTIVRSVQQDITEFAKARDRLREAEEQYRFLFEHNPVPMWVFDRDTLAFLAVNDAMVRHYGYTREELLTRTMLDIRPAEDRDAALAAARAVVAERPQGRVWTHVRRDGSRRRMAIFVHDIVFDERPARLVAGQDVTEIEASEERFQLVARATSDAIYDLEVASGELWWSDSFYSLFGYRRDQVPPTLAAWAQRVHPDDLARVDASLSAAMAAPAVSEWEQDYRFRRDDGRYAEVVDRGFFVRDGSGQAVRMLGGMLDVTEKRRRDADLRLLSRAIEATDNGVVIVDALVPDFPLVYVNRAFEEMTGYPAAECLGRNCRFLQAGERDQPGVATLRHALAEHGEARVVLRNYRKDGTMFWNEVHLAPVLSASGVVTHYVGVQTDVSHRQRHEQELAHRATHDQLTGLPNRQLLLDRLQQAILNADRYGQAACVVFIDLDDFKLINDNLDHAAGDQALQIVAGRLKSLVRGTDTVGRFGGDEFVVVLTGQEDDSPVVPVIARIAAALSQPMQIGGIEHTMTPSIGWCRYPEGGRDADTLLKHADMAMYQAKRQGRNRTVAYQAEFDTQASQRLQLVAQLRDALDRREFVLAFQPMSDRDGRVTALEGLVRWQHPQRGLLRPAEFIGVCEESGLIIELGRRTLREAARHHALLAAAGHGHVRLAVNVSALQFGYALEDDIAAVIEEFALPEGILELEITESVIMDNPERAIEAMRRIAGMGVSLSVDDFGTGYSSLAYLKRLPIDRLKIDRSFVQDLPADREAAAICQSIIALAHSLQLRTVGEGVETAAQREWLRAQGCDEIQGYLVGHPAPFAEIMDALPGTDGTAAA